MSLAQQGRVLLRLTQRRPIQSIAKRHGSYNMPARPGDKWMNSESVDVS